MISEPQSTRPLLSLPLFRPNLDVTFKGWQGGAIYIQNLVRILSHLDEAERPSIIVLTDGEIDTPIIRTLFAEAAVGGVLKPSGYPMALKPHLLKALLDEKGQPSQAATTYLLSRVTTTFPVFRTMLNWPFGLHWIPDFQHKHLPGMFDAAELQRRDDDFMTMAYGRKYLLLSSQSALNDLRMFYPGAKAKTFVWSFTSSLNAALAATADPRPQFNLPEKYLFAPNQFWKHKDHRTLFEAVGLLNQRGLKVTLACTGNSVDFRHPAYFAELQAFVQSSGLQERIKFLGTVPHDTLLQLIRFAAGVVQPSLFEGWSTVVEDAKALGRPMILSDLDVHREQAIPEVPFTFYPRGNAAALADVIAAQWEQLSAGPAPAQEAKAALAHAARTKQSAKDFLSILNQIRTGA
ncbi:MAG: glycosyltransferase [Rhodospirillaceae bacterium]|nr:glycosyltransferase [Rhodospirillaceae bacterium]